MAFPTTLQNPKADWNGTDQPVGHSSHHNVMATLLIALQTKLGIDGSTDVNSVDYKLTQAIKAVADEVHISAALAGGGFFVETAMEVSSYLSVVGGGASLFQLQSAGYGAGKYLTSDANGNANWTSLPAIPGQEEVQDFMNPALVHAFHTNITVTYDDANNRFLFSAAAGSAGVDIVSARSFL